MHVDDCPTNSTRAHPIRRLYGALGRSSEAGAAFLRDQTGHAPGKLALGGIVVWLGCMTLLSCVGSVISFTQAAGR